jgi:hypothetical protein
MGQKIAQFMDDNDSIYADRFKIVAQKVAGHFKDFGLEVVPYHDSSLPYYNKLSNEGKREAIHHLEIYNSCIETCIRSGEDFRKGDKALWHAIKELGYVPKGDMFSLLRPGHVLEIYTKEKIQIWRDYNLMTYCSYSLEEIFAYPWTLRYIRDLQDVQKIVDASEQAFNPENKENIIALLDEHSVIEKFSSKRYDLTVAHDYFCPLFKPNESSPSAIVIVSRVAINKSLADTDGLNARQPATPPGVKPNLSLVN